MRLIAQLAAAKMHGLRSITDLLALAVISQSGQTSLTDLGKKLELSSAGTSILGKRLRKKGLVRAAQARRSDNLYLKITKKGKQAILNIATPETEA